MRTALENIPLQDLIALLGGGERVGEVVLLQTLGMAASALGDRPPDVRVAHTATARTAACLRNKLNTLHRAWFAERKTGRDACSKTSTGLQSLVGRGRNHCYQMDASTKKSVSCVSLAFRQMYLSPKRYWPNACECARLDAWANTLAFPPRSTNQTINRFSRLMCDFLKLPLDRHSAGKIFLIGDRGCGAGIWGVATPFASAGIRIFPLQRSGEATQERQYHSSNSSFGQHVRVRTYCINAYLEPVNNQRWISLLVRVHHTYTYCSIAMLETVGTFFI